MAGSHNQDSSWKNATNVAQLGQLIRNTGREVAAGTGLEGRAHREVIMGSKLLGPLPSHPRLLFGDGGGWLRPGTASPFSLERMYPSSVLTASTRARDYRGAASSDRSLVTLLETAAPEPLALVLIALPQLVTGSSELRPLCSL